VGATATNALALKRPCLMAFTTREAECPAPTMLTFELLERGLSGADTKAPMNLTWETRARRISQAYGYFKLVLALWHSCTTLMLLGGLRCNTNRRYKGANELDLGTDGRGH
jgi:hypothetical protein